MDDILSLDRSPYDTEVVKYCGSRTGTVTEFRPNRASNHPPLDSIQGEAFEPIEEPTLHNESVRAFFKRSMRPESRAIVR